MWIRVYDKLQFVAPRSASNGKLKFAVHFGESNYG
jgi:hypothetical protein